MNKQINFLSITILVVGCLFTLFAISCTKEKVNGISVLLIGMWKVDSVYYHTESEDIIAGVSPEEKRYLTFSGDGRYSFHNNTEIWDSGKYTVYDRMIQFKSDIDHQGESNFYSAKIEFIDYANLSLYFTYLLPLQGQLYTGESGEKYTKVQ